MKRSIKPYLSVILIAALWAAFSASAISVLVFHLQPGLVTNQNLNNPTVTIVLYAGEISNNKMGFGYSSDNLTSPGPTLHFKLTDVVNITVINVGGMPHAFQITERPQTGAAVLFNAEAGSAQVPITPGQKASTVFAPSYAGSTFYYICPISGHAEAGMWGAVVVTA
jgi:uncharacterized cupredoxin-like copper-binding protein